MAHLYGLLKYQIGWFINNRNLLHGVKRLEMQIMALEDLVSGEGLHPDL